MVNFNKFSKSELELFLEVVKGTALEAGLRREIQRRNLLEKYEIQEQFRSDRLPDFSLDNLYKVKQLSLEFDMDMLPFFWKCACFDSNNNSKGDFYIGMFGSDKGELDRKWMHNLGYMLLLFQEESLRADYEGVYNTVNYMVNGIYKELNRWGGNVCNIHQIFSDLREKKAVVQDNFSDVVAYLWTVRNAVFDSRSSIGNQGLTVNRCKTNKKLSDSQKALIEAVAYGCSLDELEKGNYEGAKRLIYVPYNKIKK